MELTELRKELLRQHGELRRLADVVTAASERARNDAVALPQLLTELRDLYQRVRGHNAYEEEQLHAILPGIDAWGPIRDGLMGLHHGQEHAAILQAIDAATAAASAAAVAENALDALGALAAHMDREEREYLSADVLRDDLITGGVGS